MKILLVDDECMSRQATAEFLEEQLGHIVIQCGDGCEAREKLETEFFPLIISDIRMPKMDGMELLKYVKTNTSLFHSDVVLITGHGDMDTAIRALRYGAYDFIPKPIDIEQLAATVTKSMEKQALILENAELKKNSSNSKMLLGQSNNKNQFYSAMLKQNLVLPDDKLNINDLEVEIIDAALEMFDQDKAKTAKYLNITVNHLQKYLKKKQNV